MMVGKVALLWINLANSFQIFLKVGIIYKALIQVNVARHLHTIVMSLEDEQHRVDGVVHDVSVALLNECCH